VVIAQTRARTSHVEREISELVKKYKLPAPKAKQLVQDQYD
jgi:hypothetical protein